MAIAVIALAAALSIVVAHIAFATWANRRGLEVPFWSPAQQLVATSTVIAGVIAARVIVHGSWSLPAQPTTVLAVSFVVGYAVWALSVWASASRRATETVPSVGRAATGVAVGALLGATLTAW